MIVLLDLEWNVTDGKKELTQLSAVRTDEYWNALDRIDLIVRLVECGSIGSDNSASGDLKPTCFSDAVSAEECMAELEQWFESEDLLMIWSKSGQSLLDRQGKTEAVKW